LTAQASPLISLIHQYLPDIIKALITGSVLIAIGRWLYGGYRNRTMEVILAGDSSSGKTMLWYTLQDKFPKERLFPTNKVTAGRLDAVEVHNKGISYVPRLIDTAGAKGEQGLEELTRRRALDRVLRYRRKFILIYVVAPIIHDEGEIDHLFIREQLGTMRLFLRSLMHSKIYKNRTPQGALMFINKADALQSSGSQNVEKNTAQILEQLFAAHTAVFTEALKLVPHRVTRGSAKQGWQTQQVANLLANEFLHGERDLS